MASAVYRRKTGAGVDWDALEDRWDEEKLVDPSLKTVVGPGLLIRAHKVSEARLPWSTWDEPVQNEGLEREGKLAKRSPSLAPKAVEESVPGALHRVAVFDFLVSDESSPEAFLQLKATAAESTPQIAVQPMVTPQAPSFNRVPSTIFEVDESEELCTISEKVERDIPSEVRDEASKTFPVQALVLTRANTTVTTITTSTTTSQKSKKKAPGALKRLGFALVGKLPIDQAWEQIVIHGDAVETKLGEWGNAIAQVMKPKQSAIPKLSRSGLVQGQGQGASGEKDALCDEDEVFLDEFACPIP
jgi:hypothetical protein